MNCGTPQIFEIKNNLLEMIPPSISKSYAAFIALKHKEDNKFTEGSVSVRMDVVCDRVCGVKQIQIQIQLKIQIQTQQTEREDGGGAEQYNRVWGAI